MQQKRFEFAVVQAGFDGAEGLGLEGIQIVSGVGGIGGDSGRVFHHLNQLSARQRAGGRPRVFDLLLQVRQDYARPDAVLDRPASSRSALGRFSSGTAAPIPVTDSDAEGRAEIIALGTGLLRNHESALFERLQRAVRQRKLLL